MLFDMRRLGGCALLERGDLKERIVKPQVEGRGLQGGEDQCPVVERRGTDRWIVWEGLHSDR